MTNHSKNIIQPFQLDASNVRGRMVTLDSTLDNILKAHDYPKPVAHLVAETITLTLMLSSMLKYEGIFSLQIKGDGPVSMLVADVTHPEHIVRGCAAFNKERLQNAREQIAALKTSEGSQNHLAQYCGEGYIAFTVDPYDAGERYQGIVELKGDSLTECVQHYFKQSEQIDTAMKMSVGQRDGVWRSSGLMLQALPEEDINPSQGLSNVAEDDWRRLMVYMQTATDDEMLNPDITPEDMLIRLFHEDGVRVFEPHTTENGCRCSQERVENMVKMMGKEDVDYMNKNGMIEMICEFCSTQYLVTPPDQEKSPPP